MQQRRIERMETWLIWKQTIIDKGYKLWQMQYDWESPEGFIAGFMKDDKHLEITTHSKEIEDDILHSKL